MGSWQKSFSSHSVSGRRLCLCGDEIVTLISGTGKNPGRKFLRCPNWKNPSSCNFFQWIDEDFRGGEGECRGGGKCNCCEIVIERMTKKICKMKRKMEEERKKVKLLKSIIVALLVIVSAIMVVVVGYFN
ncbi:Zinc finger, GRF-type [Sesbania bispinosa]|nr:Zinc finger, GRF-type [Sesbania bispinosa]